MKNNMKQISKKALAVIVALTLVVSCLTVSFSAFATAGSFEVPAKSPAAPLYVGKTLAVSELSIEVGGSYATGDTLAWTAVSGSSATLDDGVITGVEAGVTKFSVTNGEDTQNVYIIVNEEGNDVFNIAAVDFNNGEYDADEWIGGVATLENEGDYAGNGYNNGVGTYGIYSNGAFRVFNVGVTTAEVSVGGVTKTALKVPGSDIRFATSAAFYNNTDLNDFADVDIKANMSYADRSADLKNGSPIAAAGILGRVKLNPDFTGESNEQIMADDLKCYSLRLRAYGGLVINSINGNNISLFELGKSSNNWETTTIAAGQGMCWYTKALVDGSKLLKGDSLDKDYVMFPDAYDAETYTNRAVNFRFEGNGIKYSMNGHDILDTAVTENSVSLDFAIQNEPFKQAAGKDLAAFTNYTNNINVYGGGTIAFVNNAASDNKYYEGEDELFYFDPEDLYVYDFAIAPMNIINAEAFPEYGEAQQEEESTEDITVPVNARFDLTTLKATGWEDAKASAYEIKNGVLNVYAETDAFDLTNGKLTVTVTTAAAGTDTDCDVFAPACVAIVPGDDNAYSMTINDGNYGYADLDTIKLIEGDAETIIYEFTSDDGQTFTFTTENADTFEIEATTVGGLDYLYKVYALGATKRTTEGKEAIRFLTAFPQLRVGANEAGVIDVMSWGGYGMTYGDDTILDLSGKVGALVIPSILAGDVALEDADMSTIADGYATVNGFKAQAVDITKLRGANSSYSQAWVTLNLGTLIEAGVDKTQLDYSVIPYVEYMKEGGLGYIFGTEMKRNYAEIGEGSVEPTPPGPTPVEEPELQQFPDEGLWFWIHPTNLDSHIVTPGTVIDCEVYIGPCNNLASVAPIFLHFNTDEEPEQRRKDIELHPDWMHDLGLADGLEYVPNSGAVENIKTILDAMYVEWTESTLCFDADATGYTNANPLKMYTFQYKVKDDAEPGDYTIGIEINPNNIFEDTDDMDNVPFTIVNQTTVRVVAE